MKLQILDKLGAIGAFLAAASCPACFPLLAVAGSALGLGALRPHEGIMMIAFQGLVLVALVGNVLSFRSHRRIVPLVIGVISPILIFFVFYVYFSSILLNIGLFGLLTAAVMNFIAGRQCALCKKCKKLTSIIKCPKCGFEKEETMPTDTCQFFYECHQCHAVLKPKPGDCCVYCSYGSMRCPSKQ